MSSKRFKIDMADFYIGLTIIFWFVGCLFSGVYPIITMLLYGVAFAFCYCAYKAKGLL